jgi:hypothetical protein
MLCRSLVAFVLLLAIPAFSVGANEISEAGPIRDQYKNLARTTPWKMRSDGSESRTLDFGNGVTIVEERGEGRSGSSGWDRSGAGAVLCAWEIYVLVHALAEVCPGVDADLNEALKIAVDRINHFIVENSIHPVTSDEVNAAVVRKKARALFSLPTDDPARLLELCRKSDFSPYPKKPVSRTEGSQSVDELLAIPRPPVMNPCL